jgi:ubiquinone/menaquinone biosynthesis C-methylase UbiE
MNRRYTYFRGGKDRELNVKKMKKYVEQKHELDKFFEKLIVSYIQNKKLKILDACCGIGYVSNFLSQISPASKFLGIDQTDYIINEAKKLYQDKKNISFKTIDIYDMPALYPKYFDITINWKTISWLPYYDQILKALFAITKKHIFISSLFYDGDIDFEIKVREFKKEMAKDGFNAYYNVYSFPRFKKFVCDLGAKKVESFDFKIDKDLPRSNIDFMGTYTEKLKNGKRLQISGILLMNWKVIRIDL